MNKIHQILPALRCACREDNAIPCAASSCPPPPWKHRTTARRMSCSVPFMRADSSHSRSHRQCVRITDACILRVGAPRSCAPLARRYRAKSDLPRHTDSKTFLIACTHGSLYAVKKHRSHCKTATKLRCEGVLLPAPKATECCNQTVCTCPALQSNSRQHVWLQERGNGLIRKKRQSKTGPKHQLHTREATD